jgi:acyl-coenzyme A thioesterase PaaI-like protein
MSDLKKAKRMLWLFGIFKISLIGFVRPKLLELTDKRMVVRIRLRRRTKNHLGSMYFGALAIGADLAGAFQSFYIADKMNAKLSIVFKNFEASFLKRPESDVFFISDEGLMIQEMVEETIKSKERVTKDIKISAITGYPDNPEVVSEFILGLSVKDKSKF